MEQAQILKREDANLSSSSVAFTLAILVINLSEPQFPYLIKL